MIDPKIIETRALTTSPGNDTSDVYAGFLPGIIIFVHGVNSEGEWYEQCEQGLVAGLNKRLARDNVPLRPVQYKAELFADGRIDQSLSAKSFITDPGSSPVIRFRWGYRAAGEDVTDKASVDELSKYSGKIYLNEQEAWGGGPFQNGTSALPYMWGDGLDDRLYWWVYANMLPVEGRDIYACPPRTYYAHAAHRLKELIKTIRSKQADCPITVVCHSQGNMVTLGAAMLGMEDGGALADTYILANPPYNLESLGMDRISNADSFNLEGANGGVSDHARLQTFKNFLRGVAERLNAQQQPLEDINNRQRSVDAASGKDRFLLKSLAPASDSPIPFVEGQDRDNRGRVFLYCNPHDQVIGVTPVQGMGWQGVSGKQRAEVDERKCFHVRVWAQPKRHEGEASSDKTFKVGSPDWTAYNYVADNHSLRFWNPPAPRVRFRLAFNERQGVLSRILTALTAPLLILGTRMVRVPVNDDPKSDWTVSINAPLLPEPIVPRSRRGANPSVDDQAEYSGRQDDDFDEGKDPASNYVNKEGDFGKTHGVAGSGDASTEAALRYEINARQRMDKSAGRLRKDEADMKTQTAAFLKENPNATDHSTIVGHEIHAEKVIAYDVAIGWVNPSAITPEDLMNLRQLADWRYLGKTSKEKHPLDIEGFFEYFQKGFFRAKQLPRTYDVKQMRKDAPGIVDERKLGVVAALRGPSI